MTDKIISKLVDLSIAYGEMQYKLSSFIGEHDKNGNETQQSQMRYAQMLADKNKIYDQIEVLQEVLNDR